MHLLQLGIPRLQVLESFELAEREAAVLDLPIAECGVADADLSAQVAHLLSVFAPPQHGDNLRFTESESLHGSKHRSFFLFSTEPILGKPTRPYETTFLYNLVIFSECLLIEKFSSTELRPLRPSSLRRFESELNRIMCFAIAS